MTLQTPINVKFNLIKDEQCIKDKILSCHITKKSHLKMCHLWKLDPPRAGPQIVALSDSDDPEMVLKHKRNMFVNLQVLNSLDMEAKEEIDTLKHNMMNIYVTWTFIEHYSFYDHESLDLFLFQVESPIELQSVIIGHDEKSKPSLRQADEGTLVRIGDNFDGNSSLVVIESLPVAQGLIGTNTAITYLQLDKNMLKDVVNPRWPPFEPLYHGRELVERFQNQTETSFQFQVHLLTRTINKPGIIDPENVITVSKAMGRLLKLSPSGSSSFFRCKFVHHEDDQLETKWRFTQIISSPEITNDVVAAVSPQLWFNFVQTIDNQVFCLEDQFTLVVDFESQFTPAISDLDYMAEVTIALVPNPSYAGSFDFSQILKQYFSSPRFLLKNDLLAISTYLDLTYLNQVEDNLKMNQLPTIYFKVTSTRGSGFWVKNGQTSLIQVSSLQSYIPSSMYQYHKSTFLKSYQFPFEDKKNLNSLTDHLRPYLEQKLTHVPFLLVTGSSGCGKKTILEQISRNWNMNMFVVDMNQVVFETFAATEAKIKIMAEKAAIYSPVIVVITNIDLLCLDSSGNEDRAAQVIKNSFLDASKVANGRTIIVTAITSNVNLIYKTPAISSIFGDILTLSDPYFDERISIFRHLTRQVSLSRFIDLKMILKQAVGFNFSDLRLLVTKTIALYHERMRRDSILNKNSISSALSIVQVTEDDVRTSLSQMLKRISLSIGSPEVPNVTWSDIGGLDSVKQEILDTIQLPLEHPELLASGLKRGGILLHGPPGTGKTLLAKAVASQCDLNFLSVKGPELINMYVGQSESNVREIFARARLSAPCVIFFDELDSLAPVRGAAGDSGGVMDRVVSQLLSEMDGLNKCNNLFVIGATNRLDLLDSSLLRPGRFDRVIQVDIPNDSQTRTSILNSLLRKFTLDSSVNIQQIEQSAPQNMSGADFYSLVTLAMNQAISRTVQEVESGNVSSKDAKITLTENDFKHALNVFTNQATR